MSATCGQWACTSAVAQYLASSQPWWRQMQLLVFRPEEFLAYCACLSGRQRQHRWECGSRTSWPELLWGRQNNVLMCTNNQLCGAHAVLLKPTSNPSYCRHQLTIQIDANHICSLLGTAQDARPVQHVLFKASSGGSAERGAGAACAHVELAGQCTADRSSCLVASNDHISWSIECHL